MLFIRMLVTFYVRHIYKQTDSCSIPFVIDSHIRKINSRCIGNFIRRYFSREIRAYCAINADTTAAKFPTNVHRHSSVGHILIISARGCMSIAVAFLTVKALRSCARFPRNLIVHGTAFFASFAARVALAFAFLMLRNNTTS